MAGPFAQSRIAALFDRAAADWDEAHGPMSERAEEFAARIRYLRALCQRFDRPRVIELGCATGQNLVHIADLVSAGVGLDISPAMIARARANATGFQDRLAFEVGDASDAAYSGTPFDVVLFIGTLEHLPNPGTGIAQARRMLACGGSLVVVMPHPWSPLVRLRRLRSPADAEPPSRHLTPRRLAAIAAGHGLRLAALHGLPYSPWPRLRWPVSLLPAAIPTVLHGAYAAELCSSALRPQPRVGHGMRHVPRARRQ